MDELTTALAKALDDYYANSLPDDGWAPGDRQWTEDAAAIIEKLAASGVVLAGETNRG